MNIDVKVANRIATTIGSPIIVCGNSDYVVNFTFDEEWADKNKKTARFVYCQNGSKKYIDVEFEGSTCNVPVLVNTERVTVGVYAGGIMTTTGAVLKCKKSILCGDGKEEFDLFEMGKASCPNLLEYATQLYNTYLNANFPANYEMTINVPVVTFMQSAFQGATGIVKLTVKGNTARNTVKVNGAFRIATLEILDLSEFNAIFGDADLCFYNNAKLKEIKGVIDLSNATKIEKMFGACDSLEEVRFAPLSIFSSMGFSRSSKLSSSSIQSLIDGLATVETAQTLTLNGSVADTLTEEQVLQIFNKNWSVA